ncbi:T9SS type A sorting domain-containing protein [Hymenobacter sp. CRA2]|uniref:T9SS type A sorting domain-containing protein n=1 Tax=Hymenobacter sp. CRA2 TaxID=1955620 RepID=UPI00098F54D8|nr:T9SS type A sorting domain-containing protein [Hymenobacter sp. CRA2]OON66800.1 hypothetical protein B0919_20760 [Hymenobacter sp. CRA2]
MDFIQHVARVSNWRGLALLGLLGFAGTAANAQVLGYTVATAQNVTGTYNDLGATGTAIVTANNDDATSQPQQIGFTFRYNSQQFTEFVLNTNGFIKLGNTSPSADNLINFLTNSPADVNIISAAGGVDLQAAANQSPSPTEYRMVTTGTAPNRVCTIQFKNVADKATVSGTTTIPAQFVSMQFQIKLYETTNNIELVYGTWTPNSATATGQPFLIGLKGSTPNSADRLFASKPSSATPWSVTTFSADVVQNGITYPPSHFVRNTFPPDQGRTYRFNGAPANDAEVRAIYTLGKLPRLASPHAVQAVIRNAGTNEQQSLQVTLNVRGVNTYTNTKTIPSLAAGASTTVTFDPYTVSALGNNVVTVSLPNDEVVTNNTMLFGQAVTSNAFRYDNGTVGTYIFGASPATGATATANVVKYTTNSAGTITAVNVRLASANASSTNAATVGQTVYAVALDATGTVLGRTPNYVVQANDVNILADKTFTFATPIAVTPGDFFVGLVSTYATSNLIYYPITLQDETPTRPGASYTIRAFTGTGQQVLADAAAGNAGLPMIEAVMSTTTGVSKALEAAVSVYPNPSNNGQFTLALRGANAKGNLQVEVTNLLGQRVYSGSAKDNFENRLDLSNLANGLYTLKLSQGDQYMTRSISIRK